MGVCLMLLMEANGEVQNVMSISTVISRKLYTYKVSNRREKKNNTEKQTRTT